MKKFFVFIPVFCMIQLFLPGRIDAMTVRIDKPKVRISTPAGSSINGTVAVENTSDVAVDVRAYIEDWVYTPGGDGTKIFKPPATTPLSCAKWLHIAPENFQIPPYGRQEVQFTATPPSATRGGYYAVIFFETIIGQAQNSADGTFVKVAGRMAALVYLEIEGTALRRGDLTQLLVSPPDDDKPLEINMDFKNTGNVDIISEGFFDIIDSVGNVFAHVVLDNMYTLPGDLAKSKATWPGGLAEGEYDLIITLDIGTDEVIVKEEKIKVKKSALIEGVSIEAKPDGVAVDVQVTNDGNISITAEIKAELINAQGEIIEELLFKPGLVLPHSTQIFSAILNRKIPAADYTARASLKFDDKTTSKEKKFIIE